MWTELWKCCLRPVIKVMPIYGVLEYINDFLSSQWHISIYLSVCTSVCLSTYLSVYPECLHTSFFGIFAPDTGMYWGWASYFGMLRWWWCTFFQSCLKALPFPARPCKCTMNKEHWIILLNDPFILYNIHTPKWIIEDRRMMIWQWWELICTDVTYVTEICTRKLHT